MMPLNQNETDILNHICRWGSDGYPITKLGNGRWVWHEFYGIKGAPIVYRTKREAWAAFEAYHASLLERSGEESRQRAIAELEARTR
jgi:hypothetical protein